MIILSRDQVEKEMVTVPGKLLYEFYIKEVKGNDTIYIPIKFDDMLKNSIKQN